MTPRRLLLVVVLCFGFLQCCFGEDYNSRLRRALRNRASLAQLRADADRGNAEAQAAIGMMYYWDEGRGLRNEPRHEWWSRKEAERWLLKAADQGLAEAQCNLGHLYLNEIPGQGYEQAAPWFRKAADQGLTEAQEMLGFLYFLGRGVPRDYVQSYKWVTIAAASRVKYMEGKITPQQIAEGQRLARGWKPSNRK